MGIDLNALHGVAKKKKRRGIDLNALHAEQKRIKESPTTGLSPYVPTKKPIQDVQDVDSLFKELTEAPLKRVGSSPYAPQIKETPLQQTTEAPLGLPSRDMLKGVIKTDYKGPTIGRTSPFILGLEGDESVFADPNFDWKGYDDYYKKLDIKELATWDSNKNTWDVPSEPMEMAEKYNPKAFQEMYNARVRNLGVAGDISAGVTSGKIGMIEALRGIKNVGEGLETGEVDKYKKPSIVGSLQQARAKEKEGRGFFRNLPENLASIGTQLAPSLVAGGLPGLAIAGTIAGGQQAGQALEEGATPLEAFGHGAVTGTAEALLEKYLGFVPGAKMLKGELKGLTGNILKNATRIAKSTGKKALGEGLEEVAIEPITQASRRTFFDPNVSLNPLESETYGEQGLFPLKRMAESGALGTIMGGILSGASVPGQIQQAKQVQQDIGKNLQVDLYVGNAMPDNTKSFQMATELIQQGIDPVTGQQIESNITNEQYQEYLDVLRPEIKELNNIAQENEMTQVPIEEQQRLPIMPQEEFQEGPLETQEPIQELPLQPEIVSQPTEINEAPLEQPTQIVETPPQEPQQDLRELPTQDVKTQRELIETPLDATPMTKRNLTEVGKRDVKAYQQENPEAKPFYQRIANYILKEEFVPAKKGYQGELERSIQGDVMKKFKETGMTYKEIEEGLNLIIRDAGAENVAKAKRVEIVLDDLISNGFKTIDGTKLNADTDYLKIKSEFDQTEYVEPDITPELPIPETPITQREPAPEVKPTKPQQEMVTTQLPTQEAPKPDTQFKKFKPEGKVDKKGLANDQKELEQQIKEGGLDVDLQLFAEEKLDKVKVLSKFFTNTINNNPDMTDQEKNLFSEAIKKYDLVSEKESLAEANDRLSHDFEGEVEELTEKESFSDSYDFDTAMGILTAYKNEGRKTGDYSKFKSWAKTIQTKGSTAAGQIVQAHAKYSRSPDYEIIKAQKKIDEIEAEVEKDNPNKIKDIDEQTKVLDETFKEAEKEAEKNIPDEIAKDEEIVTPEKDAPKYKKKAKAKKKDTPKAKAKKKAKEKEKKIKEKKEIDAADTLAKKIISNTNKFGKPKSKKEKDVVNAMISELYKKHKEVLPEDTVKPTDTVSKEIAKAIKERDISGDVWVKAKAKVLDQFGFEIDKNNGAIKEKEQGESDKRAKEILEQYFGTGTRPPFSQQLLNKAVKDAMKKLDINLADMVKEYYTKGIKQRGKLVDHIVKKTRLKGEDAKVLARYVQAKIKEMKKDYSEKYLESAFKEKLPPVKKDGKVIKDIEALFNTGAFENDLYADKVIDKLSSKIRQQIRESKINMTELVKKGIKKTEFSEDLFLDSVRSKLDLDQADEIVLVNVASETFNEVVEEYRDRILSNKFKTRKATEKKKLQDSVMELINLGAYSKESIRDMIKAKEGLPVLDSVDIEKILTLAEISESQHPDTSMYEIANTVINKIMSDKIPPQLRDQIVGLLRNNMLSAPTTHIKNVAGNLVFNAPAIGLENMADNLGGIIDMAVSARMGTERTTLFAPIAKAKAQTQGMIAGSKRFGRDFMISRRSEAKLTEYFKKEGLDEKGAKKFAEILAPTTKWEKVLGKYSDIDTSKVTSTYELRSGKLFKSNVMNLYDTAVKTALRMGDVPFYEGAKQLRLKELKMIKKTSTVSDEMLLDAELFALERVFQNNSVMRQKMVQLRNLLGFAGDIVMPFTQTPSNLFDKIIDYSPVRLALELKNIGTVISGVDKKGTFNQKLFVDRLKRSLTGTSMLVLFTALVKMGILSLTGDYDRSAKKRASQRNKFQRYSLKLKLGDEDYYFSYESFPPVGSLMAMSVLLYQGIKEKGLNVGTVFDSVLGGADVMISNSMMQGVMNIINNFSLLRSGTKVAQNAVSQTNPNVLKRLTKTLDPWIRETYDPNVWKQEYNKIISRVPFMSKALPKKVDVYGQDIKWSGGLNGVLNMMFNPINTSKYKPTAAQKEVYDVFENVDDASVLPNIASDKITYTDKDNKKQVVILDTEQYIKRQRLMGKYVEEQVKAMMNSQKYQSNSQEYGYKYKKAMLSRIMRESKKVSDNAIIREIEENKK